MSIEVFVESGWFSISAFVSIQGVEAAEVGVVVSGSEVVETEVGVEAFSGVEVGVGGVAGAGEEVTEGVVVEGIGDLTLVVCERSNASESIVEVVVGGPFGVIRDWVIG